MSRSPAVEVAAVASNYQDLLRAIGELIQKRIVMREMQLEAVLRARRSSVANSYATETECERLEGKRVASLNKQLASLGTALADIATAAQHDHEAK